MSPSTTKASVSAGSAVTSASGSRYGAWPVGAGSGAVASNGNGACWNCTRSVAGVRPGDSEAAGLRPRAGHGSLPLIEFSLGAASRLLVVEPDRVGRIAHPPARAIA